MTISGPEKTFLFLIQIKKVIHLPFLCRLRAEFPFLPSPTSYQRKC